MSQKHVGSLKSTDAGFSDNLTLKSKGAVPCFGGVRNGAALFPVPTVDITSKDVASDTATSKDIQWHQEDRRHASVTTSGFLSCNRGRNAVGRAPWLMPHTAEEQKYIWYHTSLGMGEKQVADEWGFKSTCVSRSQSPQNATEPLRSAINDEETGKAGSRQAA
jgi:hypothetical protein